MTSIGSIRRALLEKKVSAKELTLQALADAEAGNPKTNAFLTFASERAVAVIQLDVEGHEQEALAGATRTIARCRPLIVLETPPPESWIAQHLAPLGYSVTGTVDANTVLRQS